MDNRGLITLISGLCYAELGTMMPVTGCSYIYLKKAYGKIIAFMSGSTGYVLASCGSVSALAAAKIIPIFIDISAFGVKIIAVLLILVLTVVNYFGVKVGSIFQNFFTIAKLVPIILILLLGLLKDNQSVDLSISMSSGMSLPSFIQMFAFAMFATFLAYEGWNNLNVVAGEMKNPHKNMPIAITSAIVVVMLYVLFNYSIYRVLSVKQIIESIKEDNLYLGTLANKQTVGDFGGILVTSTMLIAIVGALNRCVLVFLRQLYSMSHNKSFFKIFGKVHQKYETPSNAIIVTALISILLVFSNDLDQLTTLVIFSGLVFNALVFYSIFVFRKRESDRIRLYKVLLYTLTPIVAVLVMIGMIINTLYTDPRTVLLGVIIIFSSLILYFIYEQLNKRGIK
ncbi:MAG: APC family permease [Bacilli bacterium]